ncbi:MAG: TIGR03936 family radical SAM-associated protein [Actinomycetota bacterium]
MTAATTIRLRFTKRGKVRFTGHRDVARIWERALRQTGVPIAYTQGFSPRPRLSFGLALPTGDESDGEYLDLLLDEPVDPEPLCEALTAALPDGFEVTAATTIERSTPSLQESVIACTWWFEVRQIERDTAGALARELLEADVLPYTRRRKGREVEVDLRSALGSLVPLGSSERGQAFSVELATKPFSVRPAELIAATHPELELGLSRRTHQWIDGDGARREPIPMPDLVHELAEVRAS